MTVPTESFRDMTDDPSRPRRARVVWLGVGLLAAGLGLLGYVVWQLFGTNVVSARHQTVLVEQLQQQWDAPAGNHAGRSQSRPGAASVLIRIPRFGDDYLMPVLEGVEDEELARGLGHVEDSAQPGQLGNFVVAAHRITHGEPLRDMPSLRAGDTVLVETRDAVYTYELDTDPNDLVVDLHADWVLDARPVNPDPRGVQAGPGSRLITLLTCAELFHTDTRMVAFGHLSATRPK